MGMVKEIQNYTIVEAKSVSELVKLTNIKTKLGWKCLGGMCFIGGGLQYQFCQSMFRMEKSSTEKPVRKFDTYRVELEAPEEIIEPTVKPKLSGPHKVNPQIPTSILTDIDISTLTDLKNNMGNSILNPIEKIRHCINKKTLLSKTSATPRMKKKNPLKKSSVHPLKKTK